MACFWDCLLRTASHSPVQRVPRILRCHTKGSWLAFNVHPYASSQSGKLGPFIVKTHTSTIANREESLHPCLREIHDCSAPITDNNPWNTTVLELLQNAVRRTPEAVALSDTQQSMTYAEVWNFAAAFRAQLIGQGVKPGDMVGVAAGRSLATVAAILGIVMVGGCYVPVDLEEFPASVLRQMTESNGLRFWIADLNSRHRACSALWDGCSVLLLEDVVCPVASELADIPEVAIHADSPLYVMFTSGSTGLPKGVVVPHRAVVRLVVGQNFMQFGPEHTFLLHSPLSFDASTLELWGSLLYGSRLVLAHGGPLGLNDYAQLVLGQGVTTLWLTAAMFHLAAEHTPEIFAPLTQLLFGGDVISPRYVERIRKLYPALHMVNGYGPTENTTFTCCYVVPADYRVDCALPIGSPVMLTLAYCAVCRYRAQCALPIGSPLSHTIVHILDANHWPVPAGQEGELATGGAGVALGYLAQPEATAERFLPDTFSNEAGAKLYLTGDRARLRQDGALEFLGRMDRQIKIAGHRVELTAVEAAISASPLVAAAAVAVLPTPSGEKQMIGCISLAKAEENAEAQIRSWLTGRLSLSSIPQRWLFLEKLPINANGKLDRTALQSICEVCLLPHIALLGTPPAANMPQEGTAGRVFDVKDELQTRSYLQLMWARLLSRTSVGADENFFDLGGTSLLLIEMHARLETQFLSVPSLVDMFAFPTPHALAARLFAGPQTGGEIQVAEQRGQRQRKAMLAQRARLATSRVSVRRLPERMAVDD